MMKLILTEATKLKRTSIYPVSCAAMILPLIFTFFSYYSGDMFSTQNWSTYLTSLNLFYGIFLSALIPSFVSIFSVYQELKSGTVKSVLFSGHSRVKVISAKIAFVSLYVMFLYAVSAVIAVVLGLALGFDASAGAVMNSFLSVFMVGVAAALFAPIMIYLTLLFKNFVAPLIIAFLGTVGSIVLINIGNAFYYPWLLPANIFFRLRDSDIMSLWPPVAVFAGYFVLFAFLSVGHFVKMDIDNKVG